MAPPPDAAGSAAVERNRRTLEVYEQRAGEWRDRRRPELRPARDFTEWVERSAGTDGAVLDAGCGPGWFLPALPAGTVAMDAAASMVDLVGVESPTSPRLRADLRALPLRRHSLRAAWANKSYVHLARSEVPLALWDLHRALAVGAVAEITLFGGDEEHAAHRGDDFAGRSFSLWPEVLSRDVIEGAGFAVEELRTEQGTGKGAVQLAARLRREHTLADVVGAGMRLLVVGMNPSRRAASAGVGFVGPGNRGWPALVAAGLADRPFDAVAMLRDHGVGSTDLAKRATVRAAEITTAELRRGLERIERLCAWLEPAAVCVMGLTGWRGATGDRQAGAGEQPRRVGGRPVWVMPNPSGLNAATSLAELVEHLRLAAALGDEAR